MTDRTLRAWLSAGAAARSVGDGLTFEISEASAKQGKASWTLRFRWGSGQREVSLGRYPDISLKEARELARQHRSQIQQGIDVTAAKRLAKVAINEALTVTELGLEWYERVIKPRYKYPVPVLNIIKRNIDPVIGKLMLREVRPSHIDKVLTKIVKNDAPTIANDVLRYLVRMFHFAFKRDWVETNPASGFELADAGGAEVARKRWLDRDELTGLSADMRSTETFGRINELAVWLLLALLVRKMELLSAQWHEFDLESGVWRLHPSRTKTEESVDIPLAREVIAWLQEVKVFSCGSKYLFPARRRVRIRMGVPRKNRFDHISPDTLNVALKRLPLVGFEHFTVHDIRRTARTHLSSLGVDRFVAERALNHKIKSVEGIYDRHDYFSERREALEKWAKFLSSIEMPLPRAACAHAAAKILSLPAPGDARTRPPAGRARLHESRNENC